MRRIGRDFFDRDTLTVAHALLGQRLVRLLDGERLAGRIVEVEAYIGEDDLASHARFGRTARNAPMYGPPGCAYVYFIYGMHHCLNVVNEREGYPAAVLIRALEPLEGIETMQARRGQEQPGQRQALPLLTNGPARLCQALGIDRRFDGADLCAPEALLFIEEDVALPAGAIASGPRIGVRGDERALTAPWRFHIRDNRYVSHQV